MPKVEQKAIRQIVKVIAEKGATWPSEIAAFTDFSEKTIGQVCRRLTEADMLERLEPQFKGGDERLRRRSQDVNGGIDAMKGRDWYALNNDRGWRMLVWNTDKIINEKGEVVDMVLDGEKPEDRINNTYIHDCTEALKSRRLL